MARDRRQRPASRWQPGRQARECGFQGVKTQGTVAAQEGNQPLNKEASPAPQSPFSEAAKDDSLEVAYFSGIIWPRISPPLFWSVWTLK
ncbi:hypothetical protein GCM10007874_00640 [Labrys miyagiensis]|uniref:Uncharacterized protein n=1 Tax=Labrys miyagiensis TaxID=346912 RepID=A0ABQ6CA22_9HYPH|nr:hypothetical protein GCM10007874_00640 [Labrys miyagiensis]